MQQQNMNMQNQQGIMQQPPAVISTKDALYLTDMLTWNLLACKKRISTLSNARTRS